MFGLGLVCFFLVEFHSVYIPVSLPYALYNFLWITNFNVILKLDWLVLDCSSSTITMKSIKHSKRNFSVCVYGQKEKRRWHKHIATTLSCLKWRNWTINYFFIAVISFWVAVFSANVSSGHVKSWNSPCLVQIFHIPPFLISDNHSTMWLDATSILFF